MLSGIALIIAFAIAMIAMVLAISRLKIHPFLSILGVSLILALLSLEPDDIPGIIGTGFSGVFSDIGIVILFGALIGRILEKTGAALKMSDCVVRLVGRKHPELAILLMGWMISILIFCDTGFVVLNPIRKALVRRTRVSSVTMTVCLSMGMYVSHCFIPPAHGPIAAAGILGIGDSLLPVMGLGALVSIPALTAGYVFARFIGTRIRDRNELQGTPGETVPDCEEPVPSCGKLPDAWLSFAPILLPALLMALRSAFLAAGIAFPFIAFLGTPLMAMTVGVLAAVTVLGTVGKWNAFRDITEETLKTVGPILFITAAGGVLGNVISAGPMMDYIREHSGLLSSMGIFFPFVLASVLKSAQGSSAVAITTAAGIVAPLLPQLGLDSPARTALTVIAIGAGSMTVSHANDSYFWVVTSLGDMDARDGYRTQTPGTLIIGIVSMLGVFVISLFL